MKKIIEFIFWAVVIAFGLWVVTSYIDVVTHNLSSEGCKIIADHWWNLFVVITK